MKIVVVVKGGMVQEVFATSYEAGVDVIDLDVPAFVSDNEQSEFDEKEREVEEMRQSADWLPVW